MKKISKLTLCAVVAGVPHIAVANSAALLGRALSPIATRVWTAKREREREQNNDNQIK